MERRETSEFSGTIVPPDFSQCWEYDFQNEFSGRVRHGLAVFINIAANMELGRVHALKYNVHAMEV